MTAALIALTLIIAVAAALTGQPRSRGYQPHRTNRPKGPPPQSPSSGHNSGRRS